MHSVRDIFGVRIKLEFVNLAASNASVTSLACLNGQSRYKVWRMTVKVEQYPNGQIDLYSFYAIVSCVAGWYKTVDWKTIAIIVSQTR